MLTDEQLRVVGIMFLGGMFTMLWYAIHFFGHTVYKSAREMLGRYTIMGNQGDDTLHRDAKFYSWMIFIAMMATVLITSIIWYVAFEIQTL